MNQFSAQFLNMWTNDNVWQQIENQINKTHESFVAHFLDLHPNTSNEELRLIMLTMLRFNPMAISICLGYKSQNVVYAMKSKLKKKLGINCSIEEYIQTIEHKNK